MPKISILLPTKRPDDIKMCLDSIKENTQDYEIIMDTETPGYNAALNKCFKKAKGDYIVIIHDDNEVLPGWVNQLEDVGSFQIGELKNTMQIHGSNFSGMPVLGESPDYSAFIEFSKEVAKKIFPLDENYKSPWCADADMGRVIKSLGLEIKPLKGKIIHWHSYGAGISHSGNEVYYANKWN